MRVVFTSFHISMSLFFFIALINERDNDFPRRATKTCLRSHFSNIGVKKHRATFQSLRHSVLGFFFPLVFGIETSNRNKKKNKHELEGGK